MRHSRATWVLLATMAFVVGGAADATAKKEKRFGIEGEIISYDEEKQILKVKVRETNVVGRFASGNTVGGKAPKDVKRLAVSEFAVEPTGSVLRRTVIKAMTGGGLDTTGTAAGFKKALSTVPDDRPVVMSLEKNDPAKVEAGGPKYKVLLIQIQFTEDELQRRFDAISVEE